MHPVLCVDVGSTFTKAVLVDAAASAASSGPAVVLAADAVPTTREEVLTGVDAVRRRTAELAGLEPVGGQDLLVCSSAGGGLRIAVIGYERVVSAQAGHRVALTAGGSVVHVHAGPLDAASLAALWASRPDVLLLVGGTDGGNAEVLLHNAARMGRRGHTAVPAVLAGNSEVAQQAAEVLAAHGRRVEPAGNVLPRIGRIEPRPARAAIRQVFLDHVIGGKGLSRGRLDGRRFPELVRCATPDAVLAGVEVLAAHSGDVLVVDVGGATTDVYSVIEAALGERPCGDVAGTVPAARTVEGDLGMRWSAVGVIEAARAEGLEPDAALVAHAHRVAADVGALPCDDVQRALDGELAAAAALIAVRRHARPAVPGADPRPVRETRLIIGSGGVLRHGGAAVQQRVLGPLTGDHAGGWPVPEHARALVDTQYLLFAAGLLAAEYPDAARALAAAIGQGASG